MKQELKVMVGIPASGKTTLAKTFAKSKANVSYISRDEVRFSMIKENDSYFAKEDAVFNEYVRRLVEAIDQGYEIVIADATHISPGSRRKLLTRIPQKDVALSYEVIHCSYDTAAARNSQRTGRANVPEDALWSMYRGFKVPTHDEKYGFKDVNIHIYKSEV